MAPLSSISSSAFHISSHFPSLAKRSAQPLSPWEIDSRLRARDAAPNQYTPGSGVIDPTSISNNGIFALFGIVGAGLVLTSIWFFFWAKNGGFHFKKSDWSDYKTTVLRLKGPNGTTLSGATVSTVLGGGSIVGSQGSMDDLVDPEKQATSGGNRKKKGKKTKNSHDADVRAYRHERVAKVGGLNREADGEYTDYTNTDRSDITSAQFPIRKVSKQPDVPATPRKPSGRFGRQFSYAGGTEVTFSVASDDSHRPLRSSPQHYRHSNSSTPAGTPRHSRQPSPTKRDSASHGGHQFGQQHNRCSSRASVPRSYTEPLDFESRYQPSEGGSEQARNTKTYFHPIPGLGRNGGAGTSGGFRRGGGGRRDSLSDSEGETVRS